MYYIALYKTVSYLFWSMRLNLLDELWNLFSDFEKVENKFHHMQFIAIWKRYKIKWFVSMLNSTVKSYNMREK